ncbi:hypothetical protein P8C59_009330 [Phyllachora maydis]|uniref:Uncharacterized protein n=1 Tax=Phyllachora maydis TaxID=1825666 RepID=A0AAD9MJL3_9PEZI|nr:hypothetical protein P8C59_009330 [Phyllachora maydis]
MSCYCVSSRGLVRWHTPARTSLDLENLIQVAHDKAVREARDRRIVGSRLAFARAIDLKLFLLRRIHLASDSAHSSRQCTSPDLFFRPRCRRGPYHPHTPRLPGSNNTIMMAAIVLERSNAYSNGADGSVNGTAENISKDLGNGGYTFSLSATKIAIIIAVIAASMIGAGIFWYYRKLDIRRRVDLRNRERAAAMVNGLPDPALGRPGDPIELVDIFANRPRTPPRPGSQGEQKDLQHPPKAALFDYVGWKDPHKTELILPKPQACNNTGHATVLSPKPEI